MSNEHEVMWEDVGPTELPRLPASFAGLVELSSVVSSFYLCGGVRKKLVTYFGEERRLERLALLLGKVWRGQDASAFVTHISGLVCVPTAECSPVHVRMAAVDWPRVWSGLVDRQVIGWAHSHPGHQLQPSATDRATQRCWFAQPWSLAMIFDPCAGTSAAYAGPECEPVTLIEDAELTALLL